VKVKQLLPHVYKILVILVFDQEYKNISCSLSPEAYKMAEKHGGATARIKTWVTSLENCGSNQFGQ
jgi:hypothetical protein